MSASRPMGRLASLCTAASSVEWYDFFLYATASAVVLGPAFFSPLGATGQTLASFATFALAFVARPLGGILFGRIGDRAGRRAALAGSTIAMGVASVLVGLLPGYATIGVAAPVILVVLRLVQGLALGGQWAGSVLLLTESAPAGRRGFWGSIAQLGSPIGGIVSSGLFFLVAAVMPAAAFADWGWRIPFLVSILVVGLGLVLQRRIEESPAFTTREAPPRAPVVEVLRHSFGTVLLAAGLFVAASASLWVYVTYLLSYLPAELGTPRTTALLVLTVTQAFQIPGIVGGATLSDRFGRRRVYLTAAIASLVWAVPAFLLIDHAGTPGLVVALAVAHLVLGAMYGPLAALYTELFAARVRYSGASLGYQLGTVLGGGLAPIIATALFAATGSSLAIAAYLVVVSVITVVAAVLVRGRSGEPLPDDGAPATERFVRPDAPGAARAPGDDAASLPLDDSNDAPLPPGNGRRRSVRTRLVALIAVPTVVAVALGVVGVTGAVRSAAAYGRVAAQADLAAAVTTTAVALDDEQATAAAYVASGRAPALRGPAADAQRRVDVASADLRRRADAVSSDAGTAASTRTRLDQALFRIDALPALRASALSSAVPAGVVVTRYAAVGADLAAVEDEVGQAAADPEIGAGVRALGALSRARAELATERALLGAAYLAGGFEPGGSQALVDADAARTGYTAQFRAAATEAQAQTYDDVVAGPQVDQTEAVLDGVLPTGATPGGPAAARSWDAASSGTLDALHTVESSVVTGVGDRARDLRSGQITTAVVAGLVALAVVIIVLVATILVVRSLTRPLRALRRGALQVADDRLPGLVTRLGSEDPSRVDTTVEPIDVRSDDEIGEVAAAFDEVHREAVRLAAAEARRRRATGALVVNLSRRTQSLVERQITLIDDLESGEDDPGRLGDLFRLDHLATRMRRNGENLLVLGGEEPQRRWTRVMPLLDVLRAAASEVEQYERVEVRGIPDVYVAEDAVSDLVHLHAELIENATAFSSRTSPVRLGATVLSDGTALIEIADRGIGLAEGELEALNERLTVAGEPDDLGPDASRRMGIVVVARLAARLGVRVRLRRGDDAGVTAVVSVPSRLVTATAPEPAPAREGAPRHAGATGSSPQDPVPDGGAGWFGGPAASEPDVQPQDTGTRPFAPTADGTTAEGLPRRRPGANRVAAERDESAPLAPAAAWDRTPTAVRHRYAGMQQGRARAGTETPPRGTPSPTPSPRPRVELRETPNRSAAAVVADPQADGLTADGLPRRSPGANYVPGSAPESLDAPTLQVPAEDAEPAANAGNATSEIDGPAPLRSASWDRSADAVRARFAGFQAGRARARTERHQEAT
ncbi:MFS transporter [Actinomycetospora termitidis]|uniref:MFS transporter n=1 Tax=Actinomycetospora termitidis TaxID=3053470 RepID=A0ABT7MI42_9PSEU|nr:MFS transporter [Actinomycetospora sp. Odt1-22]MDL5160310.1 MFS transporter [Actinomycetospora sp. Odt1-22]